MVSAPQFTPAIPELSRVLVQREDKWGVDPYLDFLGQWRVAHRAASGAHPTALNAGEISIVQGDTGGTIRLSYENAAGENVRSSLLAGTTPLVTTADHLMVGWGCYGGRGFGVRQFLGLLPSHHWGVRAERLRCEDWCCSGYHGHKQGCTALGRFLQYR